MEKTKVIILGVTGSIGQSALSILRKFPEKFELTGFSYHNNTELALQIQKEFSVKYVCCSAGDHKDAFSNVINCELVAETEELAAIDCHKVLVAVVGAVGLKPAYAAIQKSREVLLANKESLVLAGSILTAEAEKYGARILPVDSEHNSIFRLLAKNSDYRKVYITASGGALRDMSADDIKTAGIEDVLNHPTWNMGAKITVDSASMVNKALEIMEAHHLFKIAYEDLGAVIHPNSFVHAIVQGSDGSWFFHAYRPDMIYSIAYCLFYPEAPPLISAEFTDESAHELTIKEAGKISLNLPDIHFFDIDKGKYPAYYLGLEAGKKGGHYPAVFNASNEAAVEAFLKQKISFTDISKHIENALEKSAARAFDHTLEGLLEADAWARNITQNIS